MTALTDDSIMPFGKFKGSAMEDVPDWYLLSIERNYNNFFTTQLQKHPEVLEYVLDNLDVLLKNAE